MAGCRVSVAAWEMPGLRSCTVGVHALPQTCNWDSLSFLPSCFHSRFPSSPPLRPPTTPQLAICPTCHLRALGISWVAGIYHPVCRPTVAFAHLGSLSSRSWPRGQECEIRLGSRALPSVNSGASWELGLIPAVGTAYTLAHIRYAHSERMQTICTSRVILWSLF